MTPNRYQLNPVPFTAIHFSDPFWAPRIETNRAATIPHIYRKLEETGRISAFDLNFERPVPSPMVLIFGDSDPAKWIEAASYSVATHADPELAGLVERSVSKQITIIQEHRRYGDTLLCVENRAPGEMRVWLQARGE